MNLNMKFIDIGCVILLIAAVAAGGFFIQKNFSNHFLKITLEEKQLANQKNSLKLAAAKLEQLKSQFKEKENQILELNKRIPNAPRIGDFLTQLNDRIKERKIILIDFNHKPGQGIEKYKRIPVQIKVNGDFLNIYRLIHDLETLNRVFIFEKIVIQKGEEKNLCQATLLASVFQQ